MIPPPPRSPLFPYTTLFRSDPRRRAGAGDGRGDLGRVAGGVGGVPAGLSAGLRITSRTAPARRVGAPGAAGAELSEHIGQCLKVVARPLAHEADLNPVPLEQVAAVVVEKVARLLE